MVVTRFAPSPTGSLHIGNARVALFNWLWTRKNKGKFILRIEDTDIKRSDKSLVDGIVKDLEWLGLYFDEGPIFQSERLSIYRDYAKKLLEEKKAYLCFCTKQELDQMRNQMLKDKKVFVYPRKCIDLSWAQIKDYYNSGRRPVVRVKTQPGQITFVDMIRKKLSFDTSLIGDFVILKSDDTPTYNFACVIDDYLMGVTHVIRGEDHISNTPKQIILYKLLGFDKRPIYFGHLPLILGRDRQPLSKRHGAVAISSYREEGILPEAMINFLALLGWSSSDGREIINRNDLVDLFDLDRVGVNPAVFDVDKLVWMNSQYIRDLPLETLYENTKPYFEKLNISPEKQKDLILKFLSLYKKRIFVFKDIITYGNYLSDERLSYQDEKLKEVLFWEGSFVLLKKVRDVLSQVSEFSVENIERCIRELAHMEGIKAAKIIHPLRVAITASRVGPGIFEVIELLGRDKVIKRIDEALEFLHQRLNLPD